MRTFGEIAGESFLTEKEFESIESIILDHGHFDQETVRTAIDMFCTQLGMDEYYFLTTPVGTIAGHIEAVKSAEIIATLQKDEVLNVNLQNEQATHATYLVEDHHGKALQIERHIEQRYPGCRLQSYRTTGEWSALGRLRMYTVEIPKFESDGICSEEKDISLIASASFLETTTKPTYRRYQRIISRSCGWETPLIEISHKESSEELRIMVSVNHDPGSRFFSNISDVLNSCGLVSNRKYIEQFANGKTVYAIYLDEVADEELVQDLVDDISLVYVIPESPLSPLFRDGRLTAQEMVFGVAVCNFAHQFLHEYDEEYLRVAEALEDEPELVGIVRSMRSRLAKGAYDKSIIWDALVENYDCLKKAFECFDQQFNPHAERGDFEENVCQLENHCMHEVVTETAWNIFQSVVLFIQHIEKTNFYKEEKTSLSFYLDPGFLNRVDYPEAPHSVILVMGSEFRGFHIRFRDIARGGVRLVRSASRQVYTKNSDAIFDENYNLALTQQRKNKDLPEGGSKGTILLHWRYPGAQESAFKKYIDGLLDLMLPNEGVVDYLGGEILLFLGPDEGTADLMEWASARARQRGYRYWKSFTTGKPVTMGGIPHDIYAMTTNSVHEYVLQILEKHGLKETEVTKVQTGGPDGDLGSNEILISKDTTLAVVDGSGVAFDPGGLDRKELTRLARKRIPIGNFDRALLSDRGFLVTVEERDVTLPSGELIESGLEFRNTFHLRPEFSADFFVPCGGRPASININNWREVLDESGEPRFQFIVEGANLFITEEARLRLEEKAVVLYKDASANKGGVTSSSLEVFANLALSDSEHEELMLVKGGKVPEFRKNYIKEILEIIRENARLEFELIWREHHAKETPRSVLTDMLSRKINKITDAIYATDLHRDVGLLKKVLRNYCPPVLQGILTIDKLRRRIPESYLKAVFASRIASRYVYAKGLDANEMDFYSFVTDYEF